MQGGPRRELERNTGSNQRPSERSQQLELQAELLAPAQVKSAPFTMEVLPNPGAHGFIRANPKDVKELYEVSQGRVKETGMLASASDHHIFDKLGYRSKEEAVDKYLKPILTACEYGITPRVHLEGPTPAGGARLWRSDRALRRYCSLSPRSFVTRDGGRVIAANVEAEWPMVSVARPPRRM